MNTENNQKDELKLCPFCGGEADFYRQYERRSWFIFVQCEVCGARSRPQETRADPDDKDFWVCSAATKAEKDWNRRKAGI